jgi:putative DNA primase/helicase
VKIDRGRYLAAALTVLRAYHVAGRSEQREPLGSFGEWSSWVRGALLWLGQGDPVETMDAARENDPRLHGLTAVMTQWHSVIGREDVPVRAVIERAIGCLASARTETSAPWNRGYRHPDFLETLLTVAGHDGTINGERLGKWLGRAQVRIVDGLRIVRGGLSTGLQKWRIEPAP